MTNRATPRFWRDTNLPFVELRQIDDARQVRYAAHSHAHWSFGAVTHGQSDFVYRHHTYRIGTGDLVFMNPHWVHACNPVEGAPWAYLMLYVDTAWLTDLRCRLGELPQAKWEDIETATLSDSSLYRSYLAMAACLQHSAKDWREKEAVLVAYLSEVLQMLSPSITRLAPPEVLESVADYLDEHAAEPLTLDVLCAQTGFSSGYLIRSFKQHFGMTPHAYLVNRRVQLGQAALKTGTPIADAALTAGFSDQAHFQRTFKRLVAATPKQYRSPSLPSLVDHE